MMIVVSTLSKKLTAICPSHTGVDTISKEFFWTD